MFIVRECARYCLICNNITIKLEAESMLLWPRSVWGSGGRAQLSLVGSQDSGQKVDGAVGSSEVSLGKGLSARLTGGSVQCPVWCWMEGCSFLLPVGSTHPSVPWGVVLSHHGHLTCSKTVKERVHEDSCVVCCIMTTQAPPSALPLCSWLTASPGS